MMIYSVYLKEKYIKTNKIIPDIAIQKYNRFLILFNSTPSFNMAFLKSGDTSSKTETINSILNASIAPCPSIPVVKISKRKKIFQAINPKIKGIGLNGKGGRELFWFGIIIYFYSVFYVLY